MSDDAGPPGPWAAPMATGPVTGTVVVPGSKSITNRALVLAALAEGPSRIEGALRARDTDLMAGALTALGIGLAATPGADAACVDWEVVPAPLRGGAAIDVGLAGTVMRFIPPVAALADGPVALDGDPRARERPLGPLLDALRSLGVSAAADRLPLVIEGRGSVAGGTVTLDASSSSQFVSGLLLAGARYELGITVIHDGPPLPSLPHVRMTTAMLAEHGVEVEVDDADPRACRWHVPPGPIHPVDRVVEPDLSNAAPFLAAAMATSGRVTVAGWPPSTTQPGDDLRDLLARLGGTVEFTDTGLCIVGPQQMSGIDADLRDVGELTPVIAALCALAGGPSRLTGIAHLRGHETDRIAALAAMLEAVGASVEILPDGLAIAPVEPGRSRGAALTASDVHRMATAAAVLGLVVPGVTVDDIATTAKTLPGFAGRWNALVTAREAPMPGSPTR